MENKSRSEPKEKLGLFKSMRKSFSSTFSPKLYPIEATEPEDSGEETDSSEEAESDNETNDQPKNKGNKEALNEHINNPSFEENRLAFANRGKTILRTPVSQTSVYPNLNNVEEREPTEIEEDGDDESDVRPEKKKRNRRIKGQPPTRFSQRKRLEVPTSNKNDIAEAGSVEDVYLDLEKEIQNPLTIASEESSEEEDIDEIEKEISLLTTKEPNPVISGEESENDDSINQIEKEISRSKETKKSEATTTVNFKPLSPVAHYISTPFAGFLKPLIDPFRQQLQLLILNHFPLLLTIYRPHLLDS